MDSRDRELLALSLRRRVPDDDLARMYDVDAPEVARRRAAAIDRLSGELGITRGEDLGAVLKALLEDDIWSATGAPVAVGEEFAGAGGAAHEPEKESEPVVVPVPTEPVLEMLAAREGREPPAAKEPAAEPELPKERRIPHLAFALFGIGLAALLGAVALAGPHRAGDDGQASVGRDGAGDDGTRDFVPEQSGLQRRRSPPSRRSSLVTRRPTCGVPRRCGASRPGSR